MGRTHCEVGASKEHPRQRDWEVSQASKKQRTEVTLPLLAQRFQPSEEVAPMIAMVTWTSCGSGGARHVDELPDDVVAMILARAAADTLSPGHFIDVMLTSRRFCALAGRPQVLRQLPPCALRVGAGWWGPAALRFLWRCSQAGNGEASYALGMMAFYCLGRPSWGLRQLARAAGGGHPGALYSLGIVHFNGSGGTQEQRDVAAGVRLCTHAAALGHVDAMRELGHCLQDGYGLPRDPPRGRALLARANALVRPPHPPPPCPSHPAGAPPHARPSCPTHTHCPATRNLPRSTSESLQPRLVRSLSAPPYLPSTAPTVTLFAKPEPQNMAADSLAALAQKPKQSPVLLTRLVLQPAQNPHITMNLNALKCHVIDLNQSPEPETDVPMDSHPVGTPLPTESLSPDSSQPQTSALPVGAPPASPAGTPAAASEHARAFADTAATAHRGYTARQHEAMGEAGAPVEMAGEEAAGAAPSAGHGHGQGAGEQQCFCLPAVTLPLDMRADGWVHQFMLEWHCLAEIDEGLEGDDGARLQCSNAMCGRVELRVGEFRCCSACAEARYCSRVCQAEDWKLGHRYTCHRLGQVHQAQILFAGVQLQEFE